MSPAVLGLAVAAFLVAYYCFDWRSTLTRPWFERASKSEATYRVATPEESAEATAHERCAAARRVYMIDSDQAKLERDCARAWADYYGLPLDEPALLVDTMGRPITSAKHELLETFYAEHGGTYKVAILP